MLAIFILGWFSGFFFLASFDSFLGKRRAKGAEYAFYSVLLIFLALLSR